MSILFEVLFALALAFGIFLLWGFLQRKFVEPIAPHHRFSFKRKKSLITDRERVFYDTLMKVVGNEYLVVPQAHFDEFIESTDTGTEKFAARGHLERKSVDFLLCDRQSVEPLCAIELDDGTHTAVHRLERDKEEEELLKSVQLPLLRYRTEDVSAETLISDIREAVHLYT